jgi:hypothetical protein
MTIMFKQVGRTAIFSADAEVRTREGVLEVSFVETQRVPDGNLNGVLQLSLDGQPLVKTSSSVKPKSDGGKAKTVRRQFQVYDGDKVNALADSITEVFEKLRRDLLSYDKKELNALRLPCFIRIPLCRVTYSQYIIACRLRGRPAIDCLREAEMIYNNCKGNC